MRSLAFLLFFLAFITTSLNADTGSAEMSIAAVARSKYRDLVEQTSPPLLENSKATTVKETERLKQLSLQELLSQAIKHNYKVLMQRTDFGIKLAEEDQTHAIFEPEIVSSLTLEGNSQKNTVQEALSRQFASTYTERNWNYELSVNGFTPTGGKYNLGYNLRELSNSVTKDVTGKDNEYQMYFGLSLTQPLLKNFGSETTKAGIRAAEAESDVAFHDYRQEMMQTADKAAKAYWNFFQAQEKLKLLQKSIRIAEEVFIDNQERYRTGKVAKTEVYEAQAGVVSRKSLLSEADQEHLAAANELRSVLAIEASSEPIDVTAAETIDDSSFVLNKESILQRAFTLQPNYLATLASLKHADIKVAFAENQRLPELDLKASYGLNGLDFDLGGSWEQARKTKFDSWSVGLEFRMPLLGGIDSKTELKKMQLEKRRQLLALKDIEIKLTNDIDTNINNVLSALEQIDLAQEIVGIQKKLLDAELAKLKSGKSNSRLVLEKEDNYRNALEVALKNKVKLQTALISLELAEGSILLNHGLEIMERSL